MIICYNIPDVVSENCGSPSGGDDSKDSKDPV